jgi:hypothetical protein
LPQFFQKRGVSSLHLRIADDMRHQRANAPHSVRLLRPRHERPRGRRATERARRTLSASRLNKMALVLSKFRDANPSGAEMLARVLVVIGVSRLG